MNQVIPRLWLASSIALGCLATVNSVGAQIVPDNTLPVNSRVTPGCTVCTINGGTVRGVNLFHSFSEFGVPTGGGAFFNNGLQIQNIFSRVTGNSVSNIDGLLRANGTANLFLLNPNGIIFGANASLNIGGSFVASTASSLLFADGTVFGAKPDASTPPLLSVSVPLGLQYGSNPEGVEVQGAILEVGLGQTLALVGGDVQLNGGGLYTPFAPPGGRVELGGLAGEGTIGLSNDGSYLSLSFPDGVTRGDVSISNGAGVDVTAGGGGSIGISARNVNITGGTRLLAGIASGYGSVDSKAGDIEINATQAINIGASFIFNNVEAGGVGKGGNLSIDTGRLILRDGAQIGTSTSGKGSAGNLRVKATESVEVAGTSADGRVASGLSASVQPGGKGAGGELSIDTGRLILRDGAQVGTGTFGEGSSGNLRVNATESVEVAGRTADGQFPSGLFASVQPGSKGAGGELGIDTRRLIVRDGAVVSASTYGEGSAGNLRVNATESVEVVGRSADGQFPSGLGSSVEPGGKGTGGELGIDTRRLIVRDGAVVSVSTYGEGLSGNLRVNATESILLDNQASLQANTTGGGGNISLTTPLLLLRRGSSISTNATGSNIPGGNITIDTDNLVAVPKENSDISANATESFGGRVIVNAQGIFGTQFRPQDTPLSDITASSALGPQFNGVVQLNTPGIDPSRGLSSLPTELIDASSQIAQTCGAGGGEAGKNQFIVTGRRGMPSHPYEPLSSDEALADVHPPSGFSSHRNSKPVAARAVTAKPTTSNPKPPSVEAQGWVINNKGQVVLTATAPTATPYNSWLRSATCPSS